MVFLADAFCRAHFPEFPDRSPEDLYAAVNVMKHPSYIRVESDEVRGGGRGYGFNHDKINLNIIQSTRISGNVR